MTRLTQFTSGAASGSLLGLMLSAAVLGGAPSHAACVASPLDPGTNCATFTTNTDSFVVNHYAVDNLAINTSFQLGFFTSATNPVTITDLAWSRDGSTWFDFATQMLLAGEDPALRYTDVVSLAQPMGDPFQVRYTIPAAPFNPAGTFVEGDFVSSQLISNRDGKTKTEWDPEAMASVTVLKGKPGNRFTVVQRDHQDAPVDVPAPLAWLGVAGGLAMARRLRQQQGFSGMPLA